MKFESEYKKIVERDSEGVLHYYLQFVDGTGTLQKIEAEESVCDEVVLDEKIEKNGERKYFYNCVSLDEMDYEGDVFAMMDEALNGMLHLSHEAVCERVNTVFGLMKPEKAALIRGILLEDQTHAQYADQCGLSRRAVSYSLETAMKSFKKIYLKLYRKWDPSDIVD